MDLTTVALPSLIANDLVIVWPMKSRTGYIQYLKFSAGTEKGGVEQGELFNDVFRLGKMTDERVNYTGDRIVEAATAGAAFTPAWNGGALVTGAFTTIVVNGKEVEFDQLAKYTDAELATKAKKDVKIIVADTTTATEKTEVSYKFANFTVDGNNTTVAASNFPAAGVGHTVAYKVAYMYDNITIPQEKLPTLVAEMAGIELAAKARRIGIYYSNMAAFQAKTEMGVDLGEVLATQACAELSYEIDTEIVKLLTDTAIANSTEFTDLIWNKRLPLGVSKRDHYAGFAEIIEIASQHIYDATQKHAANYMIAASSLKPIFALMDSWKAANTSRISGPYYAGELNGIKVYISPALKAGQFVLGYNGGDMITSAAVFAPYMAIVPTQLLGFADGAMSQGFSSLYDVKLLNKDLLVAGQVVDEPVKVEITGAGA